MHPAFKRFPPQLLRTTGRVRSHKGGLAGGI